MGYYVSGGGDIRFLNVLTPKEKEYITRELDSAWMESVLDKSETEIEFWAVDKWNGDLEESLRNISERVPTKEGHAEFLGEDGERWAYDFVDGAWNEINGRFVWDDEPYIKQEDREEFIGQIIDTFEDFLESKGVDIQNDEKEDDEVHAILYGSDYDELRSELNRMMINWKVLAEFKVK